MTIELYVDGEYLIESVLNRPFNNLLDSLAIDKNNPPSSPALNDVLTFDGTKLVFAAGGGGSAPDNASYIVAVAEAGLSNEFALGSLATGILKNTTVTGIPTIAVAGTDYSAPGHTHVKADVTDFAHTHVKADITDFAHTHSQSDITNLVTDLADRGRLSVGNTWVEKQTYNNASAGFEFIVAKANADANNRFALAITGEMHWGDGTAVYDTTLYRYTVDWLKTDGSLSVDGDLYFNASLATGLVKHTNSSGALSIAVAGTDYAAAIHYHAQSDITNLVTDLGNKVGTTRSISTTAPLSGGGDLSADRTLSISTNGISNSLFRQGAALSVVGVTGNATANVADIVAGSDGHVLKRVGTTLVFASIGTGTPDGTKFLRDDLVWAVPSGSGGAPNDATYIVQTASGGLTNEQALGALATGILKNTTTTGVLSIAVAGTDYVTPQTTLSGYGITDAAPKAATYIVQTADGNLTNEQALGALSGGVLKAAVTTGIVSIAAKGTDFDIKNASGSSTSMGTGPMTILNLSSDSGNITGTGLTAVMTITGLSSGARYYFHCMLLYKTDATTTGIDTAVDYTGTVSTFIVEARHSTTGGSAATAAASGAASSATGNLYESQGKRTKNTIIGSGTVSVDAANTIMMCIIEGHFITTATGDLVIKLAAEAAGLVVNAMAGSTLILYSLA